MKKILALTLALSGVAHAQSIQHRDIYTGMEPSTSVTFSSLNNGAGNSGTVIVQTGTATGVRGEIELTARNVIVTTGNLGVGVTVPSGKLHVDGEVRIGTAASYVGLNVGAPVAYSVTLPPAAPAVGEVLTATSPTTLAWQPAGGGGGAPTVSRIVISTPAANNQAFEYFVCDASGGNISVSLPTVAVGNAGKRVGIKKVDATANTCTLTRSGGDLIDGATTFSTNTQYDSLEIISEGGNASWHKR